VRLHQLVNINMMLVPVTQAIGASHTTSTSFPHDVINIIRSSLIKPNTDMWRLRTQVSLDNWSKAINQSSSRPLQPLVTEVQQRRSHDETEMKEKHRPVNSSRLDLLSDGLLVQ
jgi:hypothetical protein